MKVTNEAVKEYLEDVASQLYVMSDYPAFPDYQKYAEIRLINRINEMLEVCEEDIEDLESDIEEAKIFFLENIFYAINDMAEDIEENAEKFDNFKDARKYLIDLLLSMENTFAQRIEKRIKGTAIKEAYSKMLDDFNEYLSDIMQL